MVDDSKVHSEIVDIDSVKVSVLLIVKNKSQFGSIIQFLSRRDWKCTVVSQLNETIACISREQPEFVFISYNHQNPKILKLPDILSQVFNAVYVGFCEIPDLRTESRLTASKIKYKLVGAASGPSIHRRIKQILSEIHGIKDAENKEKISDSNTSQNRMETLTIKSGERKNDLIQIAGSADGPKGPKTYMPTQNPRKPNNQEELLRSLKMALEDKKNESDEEDKAFSSEEQCNESKSPIGEHEIGTKSVSQKAVALDYNKDSKLKENSLDVEKGSAFASNTLDINKGSSSSENSLDVGKGSGMGASAMEINKGEQNPTRSLDINRGTPRTPNSLPKANEEKQKSTPIMQKGPALLTQNLHSQEVEGSEPKKKFPKETSKDPDPIVNEGSILDLDDLRHEAEQPSGQIGKMNATTASDLKKANAFINQTSKLSQEQSFLEMMLCNVINQLKPINKFENQDLKKIKSLGCITIEGEGLNGALAICSSVRENATIDKLNLFQQYFDKEVLELGKEISTRREIIYQDPPIDALDWMEQIGKLILVKEFGSGYLLTSYIGFEQKPPQLEYDNKKQKLLLPIALIQAGRELTFNSYIYLDKNEKYITYCKKGRTLSQRQIENLVNNNIKLYLEKTDINDFMFYLKINELKNQLDHYIQLTKKAG